MWDGRIILARVSQIREIFPDELHDVRYVGAAFRPIRLLIPNNLTL
jgi:hypothetical protein